MAKQINNVFGFFCKRITSSSPVYAEKKGGKHRPGEKQTTEAREEEIQLLCQNTLEAVDLYLCQMPGKAGEWHVERPYAAASGLRGYF